jgi:integrase
MGVSWLVGQPRTEAEKQRIKAGLKRYYSERTKFIRTRNSLEYKDPYNYERKLAAIMKRVSDRTGTIQRYYDDLILNYTLGYIYHTIRIISQELAGLDLSNAGEPEIMQVYRRIMLSSLSDYTKADRVYKIKCFIRWFHGGDPGYFRKMKVRKKKKAALTFTLEDVQRFLESCESDEEAAFFSTLWEGGFSVGELLKVRLRDLTVRKDYIEIYVESKDRNRTTPILRERGAIFPLGSFSRLVQHLENLRVDPEDRIWSLESYNQVQYRVRKIKAKARVYHIKTHSFRKSRATYNDMNGMSYAQNCVFGGWMIGSRTLQHYITTTGLTMIPRLQQLNI